MVALPPDGVTVALLTPMSADGTTVDEEAIDRMVGRAIAAGVAGFSPGGSTGEGFRLSAVRRRDLVSRVASAASGRPVIAGLPMLNVQDAVIDIAELAGHGADAVLVSPPGYYSLSDAETIALFTDLADRSELPVLLYQIPALAKAGFSVPVVSRLARHPRIVGIKDSSRDLEYLYAVLAATAQEEFRVVTGTDTLLPESVQLGVVGTIVASANVVPGLAVGLYQACVDGDRESIRRHRDELVTLVTACRAAGVPAGWKAAASLAGLCERTPVPPAEPPSSEALDRIGDALRDLPAGG